MTARRGAQRRKVAAASIRHLFSSCTSGRHNEDDTASVEAQALNRQPGAAPGARCGLLLLSQSSGCWGAWGAEQRAPSPRHNTLWASKLPHPLLASHALAPAAGPGPHDQLHSDASSGATPPASAAGAALATPAAAAATPLAAPAAHPHMLVEAAFAADHEVAAAALEQLCTAAKGDVALVVALGSSPRLLERLHGALATPAASAGAATPGGSPSLAHQRLQMYAAYLTSMLAGKVAAIDAALLDHRLLPALVAAALRSLDAHGGAVVGVGWGVARGALRAAAKLIEAQPACAAAQLLACGGVADMARLLAVPDAGGFSE